MIVDIYLVYQFIRRLATPFKEWKAYEYGIIDERGNILKKRRELRTVKERKAWGKFDLLVLKLKRLLEKIPGGKTRLASYAAALWLIKEGQEKNSNMLTEENLENQLFEYIKYVQENYDIEEDAPTVNVGGGHIAGVGVGPDGEPGVKRKQQEKYKKANRKRAIKRFKDTVGE
jgi:hypothetical protein